MIAPLLFFLPFALAISSRTSLLPRDGLAYNDRARVAYFLDNNPNGSSIVSLQIDAAGLLSNPARTSTHGFGVIGTNTTGFPNAVDSLSSQGSVDVSGELLFTVNAGSNTVVMFRIPTEDPTHPQIIGTPVDSLAEAPVSVSYSDRLKIVCVLNGGARAGVSCFDVDPIRGLTACGPLRTLGAAFQGPTPPTGPTGQASQVLFNPDSSAVFAVLKGAGTAPGSIIGWPVRQGRVSTQSVTNQIGDILVDFGVSFLSQSRLFIADPSYGASILDVSADLKITEVAHTVVPAQKALCWTAYNPNTPAAFGFDAAIPKAYKFNPVTGALEGSVTAANSTGGLFDSAVSDGKLYSLARSNGVVVLDVELEDQAQFLNLSAFGNRVGYTGMALWPAL